VFGVCPVRVGFSKDFTQRCIGWNTIYRTALTTSNIDMHARGSLVACFAAALFSAHTIGVEATYQYFAGYEPLTNVTRHSMVDLDLVDIVDGLGVNCGEVLGQCGGTTDCPTNACQYDGAADTMSYPTDAAQCDFIVAGYVKTNSPACSNSYDIWTHGKNSHKETGMRSISKFASGAASKGSDASVPYKSNAFISVMNKYWKSKGLDEYTWGEQMIKAAFEGNTVGDLNFGTVGRTFRKEAIQKGLIYMNVYPYAIWEMQDQINDCHAGTLTNNADGSVKAWDEAVAFWAGSQTRDEPYATSNEGNFLYKLGDKRCENFRTCSGDVTGFTGMSKVNRELISLFNRGKEIARVGKVDSCDPLDDIHEKIGTLMLVPFIQGTLRYLYKTKDAQDAKTAGELWAFATAILPFVNEVNPAAAEALYKRAWLLDFSGDYAADKKLLESTYTQLGVGKGKGLITCLSIGDLYADSNSEPLSAGTCYKTTSSSDEGEEKLALGLGLGLGLLAFVAIIVATIASVKERKTRLMYKDIMQTKLPPA
tara:strand:- start:496 stop:2106 length:1611 start_codon:yes stop_codon:yes gene_type:complete